MKRFDQASHMESESTRSQLRARRARLFEIQRIIQTELEAVERELALLGGRAEASLTEDFFWEVVMPEMLGRELTSAELRKKVESSGEVLDERRFRTFLSRLRDRGFVEMRERTNARPLWRVTEKAVGQTIKRIK